MSASDCERIPQRQLDIEDLASEILEDYPDVTTAQSVRLASGILDELYDYAREWDARYAVMYGVNGVRAMSG